MVLPASIRASLRKPEIIAEVGGHLIDRILNSPRIEDRLRAAKSMIHLLHYHIKLNHTMKPEYARRRRFARTRR